MPVPMILRGLLTAGGKMLSKRSTKISAGVAGNAFIGKQAFDAKQKGDKKKKQMKVLLGDTGTGGK